MTGHAIELAPGEQLRAFSHGWLLIVDQRPGRTWDERMWVEDLAVGGRTLHLVGV